MVGVEILFPELLRIDILWWEGLTVTGASNLTGGPALRSWW